MKIIKIVLITLGLAVGVNAVMAQTPHVQSFSARFVQTRTLAGFDQPMVSHGKLHFSRKDGFRWVINKPYHYVFTFRDGQAREQLPDGTKRSLNPKKNPWLKAVQHIFVNALSGNMTGLKQYFKIKIKPQHDNASRYIHLVPNGGVMSQVIKSIDVKESTQGAPQRLHIVQSSGGDMTIVFTPINAGE